MRAAREPHLFVVVREVLRRSVYIYPLFEHSLSRREPWLSLASFVYPIGANSQREKRPPWKKWGRGELRNSQPLTDFHDFRTFQRGERDLSVVISATGYVSSKDISLYSRRISPPFDSNASRVSARGFPRNFSSPLETQHRVEFYRAPPMHWNSTVCLLPRAGSWNPVYLVDARRIFRRKSVADLVWDFEELCTCLSFAISVIFIAVRAGNRRKYF